MIDTLRRLGEDINADFLVEGRVKRRSTCKVMNTAAEPVSVRRIKGSLRSGRALIDSQGSLEVVAY